MNNCRDMVKFLATVFLSTLAGSILVFFTNVQVLTDVHIQMAQHEVRQLDAEAQEEQQSTQPHNGTNHSKPNVLFIVLDDLNDYVETLGGHPQVQTPNIRKLMESGSVSFTQAHSNIAMCQPSRTSFLSGLYPHTSGFSNNGKMEWGKAKAVHDSPSFVAHFQANGYRTLGTGKVAHGHSPKEFDQKGHPTCDYSPFPFAKNQTKEESTLDNRIAHPSVPAPFRNFGPLVGSFGPLEELGADYAWSIHKGRGPKQFRELKFYEDGHRDPTPDEISAEWASDRLEELDREALDGEGEWNPFLLAVGFVRPHAPRHVPKKYFDMYPIETLEMPPGIKEDDLEDTLRQKLQDKDFGRDELKVLKETYYNEDMGIKKWLQSYLASVTYADDMVGQVLDTLEKTSLKDNTIVVLTSDHGFHIGQKDYLFKNTLWQPATRVPFVMRVPGLTTENGSSSTCDKPVSLIDIYPTLLDLCDMPDTEYQPPHGRPLDGHSLRPLLADPENGSWDGPDFALTALSRSRFPRTEPYLVSHALRYSDWRYIRYASGAEELYDTKEDPYEWDNLALLANDPDNHEFDEILEKFRRDLDEITGPIVRSKLYVADM